MSTSTAPGPGWISVDEAGGNLTVAQRAALEARHKAQRIHDQQMTLETAVALHRASYACSDVGLSFDGEWVRGS
jgi:hypothetical protein